MANSKTYRIDPNNFNQSALDGTAELPADKDATFWAKLFAVANKESGYESVDTTATALALDVRLSELSISGTDTFTLAAPTYAGQEKTIRVVGAASIPVGTLTVTSPDDTVGFVCQATFVFDTVGQEITLKATPGLKWRCIEKKRAGYVTGIVCGTTSLTGKSMATTYVVAVDGTDAGSTTTVIPNGSCVGERCNITCSQADNIPVGSVTGVFTGMLGNAYTTIGTIGVVASTTVVGDTALLEWDGQAWVVKYQNGCTLS